MNGFKILALQDLSHMLPVKYMQVSIKFCQPRHLAKIYYLTINKKYK